MKDAQIDTSDIDRATKDDEELTDIELRLPLRELIRGIQDNFGPILHELARDAGDLAFGELEEDYREIAAYIKGCADAVTAVEARGRTDREEKMSDIHLALRYAYRRLCVSWGDRERQKWAGKMVDILNGECLKRVK